MRTATPNRAKRTPAYKKIAAAIRKQIDGGGLHPGDLIESERDLAKAHNVSLMTARQALIDLEREGIVHRRPGSGTFVAPPRIHFNRLVGFSEQMLSRGFIPRSRLLSAAISEGDPEITAKLALPDEAPLIRIQRLRLGNAEPFAVETVYLDANRFKRILTASLDRRSLFQILIDDYEVQLAYADEEVDATQAEGRSADLLQVPHGTPILRIRQILYSKEAQPISYSLALYRSEKHSLFIRRFR